MDTKAGLLLAPQHELVRGELPYATLSPLQKGPNPSSSWWILSYLSKIPYPPLALLEPALSEAGFKSIGMFGREAPQLDIWAVATKKKIESKDKMMEIVNLHLPTKKQSKV